MHRPSLLRCRSASVSRPLSHWLVMAMEMGKRKAVQQVVEQPERAGLAADH